MIHLSESFIKSVSSQNIMPCGTTWERLFLLHRRNEKRENKRKIFCHILFDALGYLSNPQNPLTIDDKYVLKLKI